jgi:hypothetical protein
VVPPSAGKPPVPQPVELLKLAFALRPRPLRYRWARTEFPGEVFEEDLLFRMGQFVHGGFDFRGRAHARKSSRPHSPPQASRQVDKGNSTFFGRRLFYIRTRWLMLLGHARGEGRNQGERASAAPIHEFIIPH